MQKLALTVWIIFILQNFINTMQQTFTDENPRPATRYKRQQPTSIQVKCTARYFLDFDPFLISELFDPYHLDESIPNFRDFWWLFLFLLHFP